MKNYRIVLLLMILSVTLLAEEKGGLPLPPSGNVTLPLDSYDKLVELAGKPPKKTDVPPLPYAIKRADLKLRVVNQSVLGTVQLQGEVFSKGISKVPLLTGVTVLDARREGQPLPLQHEGETHTAVLSGPAEFSVALDVGLRLNIGAGSASFNLPIPAAGAVRLTLEMPGDHANVKINPGLVTSRASDKGKTIIEATLPPGQPASIWWTTRETAAPTAPREVRFLSDIKTLVSVHEAELRLVALADISIIQGEPTKFEVEVPPDYEVSGVTGPSLESSEVQSGVLNLTVSGATQRNHQFLISLERSVSSTKTNVPFLNFRGTQRETGEVLVEGAGAVELTANEGGGLKRMDLKETNAYLRSLARFPMQAAFRYHRQAAESPTLALEWVRFPDASVLAAIAERAIVTTLVTSEGRSLTEVKLVIKNQAQPFLKVALPADATILSADVAGEKVKPVQAADGSRVPLLRPGFRPADSYTVSFVFMHSGAPFAKKGGSELILPQMDVPIGLLHWEVFLPEQYKVKDFGGDVISASLVPASPEVPGVTFNEGVIEAEGSSMGGYVRTPSLFPGQLGGVIVDPTGAVIPNAKITVVHPETGTSATVFTDHSGRWVVSDIPAGRVTITAEAPGFKRYRLQATHDLGHPSSYDFTMSVAAANETVEVTVSASTLDTIGLRSERKKSALPQNAASSNVLNLQRRVAGVLPVAIDVPRAGNSFRFVRPLVLDEETKVTFMYRSK